MLSRLLRPAVVARKPGALRRNFSLLREAQDIMNGEKLTCLIVPMSDYHMSEYIPNEFKLVEKMSGFTGSAGTLLLESGLDRKGTIFVDGRYFVQADKELNKDEWQIVKLGADKKTFSIFDYIKQRAALSSGQISIGLDPYLHSIDYVSRLNSIVKDFPHVSLKFSRMSSLIRENGANELKHSVYVHDIEFAGLTISQKLDNIRSELALISKWKGHKSMALVVTALDEIAWLFNLRGRDVECNPVFASYAIVTKNEANLFVNTSKLSPDIISYLAANNVVVHEYNINSLNSVAETCFLDNYSLIFDKKSASFGVFDNISSIAKQKSNTDDEPVVLIENSIVSLLKCVKNEKEIAGLKSCHLRDAAALVEFIAYLSKELEAGSNFCVSEVEIDKKLAECRRMISKEKYICDSFATIAAVGANAAIVHYRADEKGNASNLESRSNGRKNSNWLLLDSGAQYRDGTTDVTRTLCFEKMDNEGITQMKEDFTRVLKGFLAVDQAVFENQNIDRSHYNLQYYRGQCFHGSNTGHSLDVLARQHLLRVKKNYMHGTGHGVGAALNVHEQPVSISNNSNSNFILNKMPLLPGMVFSNEPGFYDYDAGYGIRIENLVYVTEDSVDKNFLRLEKLTMVPIQKNLMDLRLLSSEEISIIDSYHKDIFHKIYPLLLTDCARKWLEDATSPIKYN